MCGQTDILYIKIKGKIKIIKKNKKQRSVTSGWNIMAKKINWNGNG